MPSHTSLRCSVWLDICTSLCCPCTRPLPQAALVLILSWVIASTCCLSSDIRFYNVHWLCQAFKAECVPTSSNQRRRPCILLLRFNHPQGQAKLKELARTSRSHIARDALLLLVHPEWRKSRSTPQPFTLFSSRCYDAYCTACVVSTFAICFHEPVFPSNGVRGNKESYGLEGGASAFRRYPLQSSEGGKEKTNSEMERKSSLGRLRGG
jgi:hypothetical protein